MSAAAFLLPALAQAACPVPPARPGAEVVNPFVAPLVYSPSTSTFEAYKGFGDAVPSNGSASSLGKLAAAFERNQVSAPDGVVWHTDENETESRPGLEWQAFVFYVSPALAGASSIVFEWQGVGALSAFGAKRTYLLAFNFDLARWDILANVSFTVPVDQVVRGEIQQNASSYLQANRTVVMVAGEQGGITDLGNVGRPGGNPTPSTYLESDYIELDAFLPTSIGPFSVPLGYNATVFGQVTFRGPMMLVDGNITVASGGTLTLDHARLAMVGADTWIRVEAGGSLRVLNGSVITDSPTDVDDLSASDLHYFIEVQPAGEFDLENSRVENAGVPGGPAAQRGLFLADASGAICKAELEGPGTGLLADHLVNLTVESFTVNNSGGPPVELQLQNESHLDGLGLNFTTLAISPDSTLVVRTAIDIEVVDTSGKPIRGVDLKMTDNGATIYASAGFGGTDGQTARTTDFDDNPLRTVLPTVARVFLGSPVNTTNVTTVTAKYFAWSETRTVSTAAPHTERFTMSLPALAFTDAAAAKGYGQVPQVGSPFDSFGPAVALADYNGDGLVDIFIAGGATRGEVDPLSAEPNRLLRHQPGGTFVDVTAAARLTSSGATAAAWGDFDNDGFPDLYLVYTGYGTDRAGMLWPGRANALYHNNGDGTFTDVTQQAGVGDTGHGSSAAWGDYDGDGYLDLYVGNVGWVLGWVVRNETNVLYHNDRDGTFTDVTRALGVTGGGPNRAGDRQELIYLNGENATPEGRDSPNGAGFTQGVAWFDYDRDGDLDLFVANDFGSSVLYRNNGDGSFTVVTQQAGLQRVGSARGVAVADLDGDGWLDIIQPNRWVDFVWRNNHDGTFTDIAPQLGLDEELPGTTAVPIDFNLDGRTDLFVGGGRVSTFHAYAPSYLWQNEGAGRFADVTASAGVDSPGQNRTMGASAADLDGNGSPDLVTANADRPGALFLNGAPTALWLKVHLTGTASPRDGQGAQVTLQAPGAARPQVQQVGGVGARGSQLPNELLFGLPGAPPSSAMPWHLEVRWTSGVVQDVNVTGGNQVVTVVENSTMAIDPIAPVVVPEDTNVTLSVALSSSDPKVNATAVVGWSLPAPDGNVALSGRSASVVFPTPGHFVGRVSVRGRTGATASASVEVTVLDRTAPVIPPFDNMTAAAGSAVAFSAAAVADNDPQFAAVGNFSWTFVDAGESVTLYGRDAQHAFAAPGDYEVTLTVRDGANNTATGVLRVTVVAAAGFGAREIAIVLLVVLAGAVAGAALWRARKRREEELERQRQLALKKGKKKKGQPKEGRTSRPPPSEGEDGASTSDGVAEQDAGSPAGPNFKRKGLK